MPCGPEPSGGGGGWSPGGGGGGAPEGGGGRCPFIVTKLQMRTYVLFRKKRTYSHSTISSILSLGLVELHLLLE